MFEAMLGFAAMFVLMALRVPIAISMALVGLAGLGLMRSWPAAFSSTTSLPRGVSSPTACSPRARNTGCFFASTTRTCASPRVAEWWV